MTDKRKETTFQDMMVLEEAFNDISFLERILQILLFDEYLTLEKCTKDKLIAIEGQIVFSYDFVAFGKDKGIYGICLLDHYDDEIEEDFLYIHGLLRNTYDKENKRGDIYTLCLCKTDGREKVPSYLPGLDLVELFGRYEFMDKGVRIFAIQRREKPLSLLESILNDFASDKISDIKNDFIREKLEWTLWERKNRKHTDVY